MDEWDKGFVDGEEEREGYWMELVKGAVPAELEGTLLRWVLLLMSVAERASGRGRR